MGDHHFMHEDSDDASGYRDTLEPIRAKTCYFYKEEDYRFAGVKIAVHPKRYRSINVLLSELSYKIPSLPNGVRGVFTPRGRHNVSNVNDLKDGGQYVCASRKHFAHGLDVERVHPPELWHIAKPRSGIRELNAMLGESEFDDGPKRRQRLRMGYGGRDANKMPKKVTILKNGDPSFRHIMLLNRKTAQTFDQVLCDLSEMFKFACRKLYTVEGKKVLGLSQLFNGPEVFVVAGRESFKSMWSLAYSPHPPNNIGRHRMRSRNPTSDTIGSRVRNRRDRLLRSRGHWKVLVTTNELASAGTLAQVTLTVYGHKANSGPIPLGSPDSENFQPGQIDEFDVTTGNIGDIYKIRIAHDNTGDFPGWLCDEVRLKDLDSREELVFPCKRWLARDEDDHEICREIATIRRGEPTLPLIKYEVSVTTGNLWNGGTDANVYLTIYGDRGDTGVRQLYTENRKHCFRQGQTDNFQVEAVSLGHLKRIIVGHDATGPGSGWFLDRVVIREPGAKHGESYNFYCNRWLDEGEDDGKIVRELRVQDEYMDDIVEKRNWEYEKWKFENRNQIMFFSHATGKALRIKPDGTVDGLGEVKDAGSVFSVHKKKSMVHVFSSQFNPSFHLAIENGKLLGHGRGGSLCEFRVRVQSDQAVVLEAVKNPLQFVTILDSGRPGDVRGILDQDPTQRFSVYCKGMFRQRGIIMFRTSPTQAINVDHDKSVFGTGRCNRGAHFRVHKVGEGGLRMFESMIYQGNFLRLRDGKFDCAGGKEEASHFLVAKHRDKGYIVLQSAISRGLYVGLTPQGKIHPTVDTGVRNVWLYPEVIEFGVPKTRGGTKLASVREVKETPRDERPPPQTKSVSPQPDVEDGDWKIIVSTSESLEDGDVAMVAYGDKGNSGPVILAAPVQNGPLFQTGSNDEFKTNLKKCGKLYKIRLELIAKNPTKMPSWKVREVKMQDLNSKELLKFQFNRWLSRNREDGEIMREMPVARRGEDVLPLLTYVVEVTTGKERDADTDADVHITMYGERGDSGKRLLHQSNNRIPFRRGQTDVFEIEAVHLSKIRKIQIGHNATGSGDGWYLEEVRIKEKEGASEEYIFPCQRWFDSSKEDCRIERTLNVMEPAPTKIITAMRRESSEYASMVVTAAIEAAAKNLTLGLGLDHHQSNTSHNSAVHSKDNVHVDKVDDHIGDNDTDHSDVSDSGDLQLVPIEPDHDSINTVVSDDNQNDGPSGHTHNDSNNDDKESEARKAATVEGTKGGKYKPGDWKVWTTTGKSEECATKDEVVLFVYGSSGHVGPLTLGRGDNQYFKSGETDEFDVQFQRKLGDLYKIRIGLYETVPDTSWFLEKVRLKDMSSNDEYTLKVNRWMSRTEEDHDVWREVPLSRNQRPLPVHVYQVEVFTGNMDGADTDASVHITICGERGDTGKRKLYMSKSNKKAFQRGKIDVFDLEAVSLGELERLFIGHDAVRAGQGWYLEKIVIKESTDVNSRQFYFPCEKWLDSGKEDKKIERELLPADPPAVSQGDYKLWIKTAGDSKPPNGGKVSIALYGTSGKSEDMELFAPSAKAKLFEPGSTDEFEVAVGDIGELQKIRISREDHEEWKGWHLQEVTLQDKHTREEQIFKFDRWLGRGLDDSDLAREAAVVDGGKPVQPVYHYELTVYTGDHWAGETDAEVYMTLYGSLGDTGRRVLYSSPTEEPKFRKGQSDKFVFEAVKLGELQNLVIGHSSKGHGAGWFLDKVLVTEKDGNQSHVQYVFPCYQWLDDGEGDGAIERNLRVIDAIDGRKKSPKKKSGKDTGAYEVLVKTSDDPEAGTQSTVTLTLCGKHGDSKPQPLSDPKADLLQPGREAKFQVNVGNIGEVNKIRLEHEKGRGSSAWRCDYVKLTNTGTGEELVFYVDSWLADEKDDGQMVREVAASKPGQTVHPALQYVVMIQTGRGPRDGASDGQVSINLYGTHGNTGLRPLTHSLSGPASSMWRESHLDVFLVPAVSVGKLQQVQLKFIGKGRDKEWTVERVTVLEGVSAIVESVCYCNQTLKDDGQGCLRSFPVADPQISSGLPEDIVSHIRERNERSSHGKWTAWVYTGGQSDAGTKDKVMMVVYGTTGHTEPKHINRDGALTVGSCLKFQMSVGGIGKMIKVRIYFESTSGNSAWFLQKMKLKDAHTAEEFNLHYNDWVRSSPENPGGTIELPTIRPDIAPLQATTYTVTVTTGDFPVAETDAEVFCTLIGQWGDSGERVLVPTQQNRKIFRQGQKDEFEIRTLDLGVLSKLLIGHNEIGRGRGWHCERVSVIPSSRPKQAAVETIFLCNRWMDSGCEDRQLVRELTPLVHLEPTTEITPAQRSKSKGMWTCFVTVATEDKLDMRQTDFSRPWSVDLVIYGSRNIMGPVQLTDGKKTKLQPGQTHKFTDIKLKDVGEIEKIRVTLGDEKDPEPVWTIQQVTLEDPSTGESLKFSFDPWVGEVNSDMSKELPVIKPGQSFTPLTDYQVSIYTSNVKNAGTQADIFINIHGKTRDSGQRHLRSNINNSKMFQQGQVDVFTVNAVDLGDIHRLTVTKGRGDPWYLDKICVKAGTFNNTEWIFEADRWLGSDKTKSTVVDESLTLTQTKPSSVAVPPESADDLPQTRGQWKVETVTGRGGTRGNVSDLVVVLCGDRGESSLLQLKSSSDKPFQANKADTCQVKLAEDIGEIFKVRLGFQDNGEEKAWNLDKIRFEDEDTHDCFSYNLDSWVAVDDNQDGWREFPTVWPAVRVLPVVKYEVSVYLGDVPKSTSDLDLYIEIMGEMGGTGQRQLKRSLNNSKKFQPNQMDEFQIEAVSVMTIQSVIVGHTNREKGRGLYLKRVVVKDTTEDKEYVFVCDRWLDKGQDDRAIERTLYPHTGPIVDDPPPVKPASPTGDPWTVWTTTATEHDCGTGYTVTLVLYGDKGHTEPVLIGEDDDFNFEEGAEDKFDVRVTRDPGELYKIRVCFDGAQEKQREWYAEFDTSPSWKPEKITLLNTRTNKKYEFVSNEWVRLTEYADFAVELPVIHEDESKILNVYKYDVEVFTGDVRFAGTNANVYVQIYGERGDTGKRHLHGSYTNSNKFEQGQCDLFEIDAVDLGQLKKVKVSHDGYGPGSGWFLDKIVIEVPQEGNDKYVFRCGRWLDEGEDDKTLERVLTMTEVVKADKPKVGDWQVVVVTAEEEDSGTDARVYLTVYGNKGKSEEKRIDGHFESGRADHVDVWLDPDQIGKIKKIRLRHDDSGSAAGWRVKQVIMVNRENDDRLEFPIDRWLSFTEKYGDISVEVPAQWPNETPDTVYKYIVQTTTASSWGSGTDANVYINIVGTNGDCGKRFLRNSVEDKNKFETGSVDTFYVEAVDLGKLEKIIVGHDGSGAGSGWKLDCVTVQISKNKVHYFNYGKWIDEGKDDKVTEAEIPLTEIRKEK